MADHARTQDTGIPLRMTKAERKKMEAAAKKSGRSLSNWIRRTCLKAAEEETK